MPLALKNSDTVLGLHNCVTFPSHPHAQIFPQFTGEICSGNESEAIHKALQSVVDMTLQLQVKMKEKYEGKETANQTAGNRKMPRLGTSFYFCY